MERYPNSTCAACRHYNEIGLECRRNPEYVPREKGDWCGEFRSAAASALGGVPKVADEVIIGLVKEATRELREDHGDHFNLPATAMLQSALVESLTMDPHNMASTPAYKRVGTMVRRGQLCRGLEAPEGLARPHTFVDEKRVPVPEGTVLIWLPKAKAMPQEGVQPKGRPMAFSDDEFVGAMIQGGLVSEDRAASVRKVLRVVEQSHPMSVGTVHTRLKRLVADGRVLSSGYGYWVRPPVVEEEVP